MAQTMNSKNKTKRIVIIGGGASGLMAAIMAARRGAQVTIIEHKDRVGKKILMTGNGRCNLTNMNDIRNKYYGEDLDSIYRIIENFDARKVRAFFEEIGLYTKEKKDGGVYPVSEQASGVLDVLRTECAHLHIQSWTECDVVNIQPTEDGGIVEYKRKIDDQLQKGKLKYDALILATGGKAAPVSGSDGSGYQLVKKIGHSLITPLPALVQLRCDGNYFKMVSGVRAQAKLQVYVNQKYCVQEEGELQITDYGISGIPVFQFSRIIARALHQKQQCEVHINFLTYMSDEQIDTLMKETAKQFSYKTAEEFFSGLVHKKLALLICKLSNIKPTTMLSELSKEEYEKCIHYLIDWKVTVKETNPFENAQVCCGGVPLSEVNNVMESKKCPHIYLVGELLDCDGICGGYNLQWAWSTGAIAGMHAAQ